MTATPTPDDGALAACPFCGAEPTVTEAIGYWVQCKACPRDRTAWTWDHNKAKAIAIWNQRWQARSPAPVSGEAAERAAAEIMGRFAVHRSERNLQEIAAIITHHCAGAGRVGG